MATKKKPADETASKPKDVLEVPLRFADDTEADAFAWTLARPEVQAAVTMQKWQGATEVPAIVKTLAIHIEKMHKGSMEQAETMLLAQAHTLDELFNNLARRAKNQDYMCNFETYLCLALKAQSQCRATLETLSNIKNPPIVYAKQANIANNQLFNNGVSATHAGETKNQPNELFTIFPLWWAKDWANCKARSENVIKLMRSLVPSQMVSAFIP